MHSCKLFGIYPRNHDRKRDFQKKFSWANIWKGLPTSVQIFK